MTSAFTASTDPHAAFRASLLDGLTRSPKKTEPKYLYDERGSELFDQITTVPEYYVTRIEAAIMRERLPEIAERLGKGVSVIEPGAGNGSKLSKLMSSLAQPEAAAPLDISKAYVEAAADRLETDHPELRVEAMQGDFTEDFHDAIEHAGLEEPVLYFPGSTLGNFEIEDAQRLLRVFRRSLGSRGRLLLGVDLVKPADVLIPAYDDAQGVTAAFNLNLLHRANRELDADFDTEAFHHEARWNEERSRVEMHIVCDADQTVAIGGVGFTFHKGESIHTESSHKFTPESLRQLLRDAGWRTEDMWMDEKGWFSVTLASATDASAPHIDG